MTPDKLKFGTDGWRAIIAKDYTVYNVARVASALAKWLLKNAKEGSTPLVVIGHDCRFGGRMFSETTADVLCGAGIKVLMPNDFASTPMVSLGVLTHKADQGVVITASHNPAEYNGFKLKGPHGGPSTTKTISEVEALIEDEVTIPGKGLQEWEKAGLFGWIDLEREYLDYIEKKFDFPTLNASPFKIAYDAMYGAGQNVIRQIIPGAVLLHCEVNPSFKGTQPEPLDKHLRELSVTLAKTPELAIGLATDGDADRIGLYDGDGDFVEAHHVILLLIHYLHKYKGMNGKVVVAFSVTNRVKKMCDAYGLPIEVTKIGFKYISEVIVQDDVLVGGEESGGIAVKGHIPERDGIFDGMLLLEFMTQTGKTMKQLLEEVYEVVGAFYYKRDDMHIAEAKKQEIIKTAEGGGYKDFGKYFYTHTENIDGVKYYLKDGGWVMLRASGTEPVLRIYAEGNSKEEADDILKEVKKTIGI